MENDQGNRRWQMCVFIDPNMKMLACCRNFGQSINMKLFLKLVVYQLFGHPGLGGEFTSVE